MQPIDLQKEFGKSYRVTYEDNNKYAWAAEDRVWLLQIEGKLGIIYPYSDKELGLICISTKVAKILGKSMHRGEELTFKFPLKDAKKILKLIKAKRKRSFTPDQLQAKRENMAKVRAMKNG